jgi:predicted RNA-binding Zn ribbon-like protein
MAVIGQAPGELAKLQSFVNTLDIEQSTDELAAPADLDRWLETAGLAGPGPGRPAGPDELAAAVELREALRAVLLSHVTHPAAAPDGAPAAPARLAAAAAAARARITTAADGSVALVPDGGGSGAGLTRLLLIAARATATGTWDRLKACSADDCHWAFYDRSPTRNGCWCSMQICGSRAKSRAYRSRAAVLSGDGSGRDSTTTSQSARTAAPGA